MRKVSSRGNGMCVVVVVVVVVVVAVVVVFVVVAQLEKWWLIGLRCSALFTGPLCVGALIFRYVVAH